MHDLCAHSLCVLCDSAVSLLPAPRELLPLIKHSITKEGTTIMAQLGVILKLAANIDPILYTLATASVVYLLILGIIHWKRNNPDKWQRIVISTGIPKLTQWLLEKWHNLREATNVTWHL